MQILSWQPSTDRYGPSRRSRAAAFALSLATSALLFIIMIRMGAFTPLADTGGAQLVAIDLTDKGQAEKKRSAAKAQASPQKQRQAQAAQATASAPPPVPLPNQPQWPEGFIMMNSKDYAAADVSKMKRAESSGSASASGDSGAAYGPGAGPGGARLYNAQWYREPSRAELAGYMPTGRMPGEWAMIACRTVEKFHVEDCQEIDESPRGSGLARALRQASWQFLVRPPRENGKSMVGAWVRIRFDFKKGKDVDAGGVEGG